MNSSQSLIESSFFQSSSFVRLNSHISCRMILKPPDKYYSITLLENFPPKKRRIKGCLTIHKNELISRIKSLQGSLYMASNLPRRASHP